MNCQAIFNFRHIDFVPKQIFHRRYLFTIAGDDQVKKTKVRIHIERKPMSRYPAGNVYADRCHLSSRSMHAGKALQSERANLEASQGSN